MDEYTIQLNLLANLKSQLAIQKVIKNYEDRVAIESQYSSKTYFYRSAAEVIIVELERQISEIENNSLFLAHKNVI